MDVSFSPTNCLNLIIITMVSFVKVVIQPYNRLLQKAWAVLPTSIEKVVGNL